MSQPGGAASVTPPPPPPPPPPAGASHDADFDAAREQLLERIAGLDLGEGVNPEDAAALRDELTGMVERFQPEAGQSTDGALAALRDEYDQRVQDFTQDQKIEALIDEQLRDNEAETGTDAATGEAPAGMPATDEPDDGEGVEPDPSGGLVPGEVLDPPLIDLVDPPLIDLVDPPILDLVDPPILDLVDPPILSTIDPAVVDAVADVIGGGIPAPGPDTGSIIDEAGLDVRAVVDLGDGPPPFISDSFDDLVGDVGGTPFEFAETATGFVGEAVSGVVDQVDVLGDSAGDTGNMLNINLGQVLEPIVDLVGESPVGDPTGGPISSPFDTGGAGFLDNITEIVSDPLDLGDGLSSIDTGIPDFAGHSLGDAADDAIDDVDDTISGIADDIGL